ncbi:MAG: response regulator [candidate division KSB1 bacterium]|nr:response regulator [candidate division KSB1 bacterium]
MMKTIKSSVIVSEDSKVATQLTDILLKHDYTVTIEKSILKFICNILDKEINLLILDMDVPKTFNLDSIEIIRKIRPRLPIIVVMADTSLDALKTMVQKGVFYTAIKPVQSEDLNEVIKALDLSETRKNRNSSYNCMIN